MNKVVTYLESKEVIFHGSLVLIILYVPHAGSLFKHLEHLDMTLSGYTFLNWMYGIALAGVIEFLILVFIINKYRTVGKFYAIISFFLNAFYYDYWFIAINDPTLGNLKLTVISLCICLTHSLSIWHLSDLFFIRVQEDRKEQWCPECDAGPFPNKRSLDGHISKAHKTGSKSLKKVERFQQENPSL